MTGTAGADHGISVVIVGGGYAGMIASNRLLGSLTSEERARVRVTIINPTDRFIHRIRLHEQAAGIAEASLDLTSMLHSQCKVLLGRAERIDAAGSFVHVRTPAGADQVRYDWLLYAVGSRSSSAVRGVTQYAVSIGDIGGAREIARRFADSRIGTACVVGGGPAGVETAAELAEAHADTRVALLAGHQLLTGMRPAARRPIRRRLERLGVEVVEGARVTEVTAGGVTVVSGAVLSFDLVVCSAGFEVPELAGHSGLPVDSHGRLLVDDTLTCVSVPTILGAGDAVKAPDAVSHHLPMGARTALPLGGAAADTLLARLRGDAPRPISIGLLGPSISLGRSDGYIQLARRDDAPTLIAFTGALGAAIKAWVCRMTVATPRTERTSPGAYRVPRGPRPSRQIQQVAPAEASTRGSRRAPLESGHPRPSRVSAERSPVHPGDFLLLEASITGLGASCWAVVDQVECENNPSELPWSAGPSYPHRVGYRIVNQRRADPSIVQLGTVWLNAAGCDPSGGVERIRGWQGLDRCSRR